ncbi:hypothetical protein [Paraburkholderia sp. BL27I4N3]|uniref:hypothetical protein n=1 Tax=Paraburkholderia sp. BL27I4N3 TaxID=1938805 RepID=UPI0015F259B7|nr:hypothetical protein [Paraburkholderia sp. BL27I4N3]
MSCSIAFQINLLSLNAAVETVRAMAPVTAARYAAYNAYLDLPDRVRKLKVGEQRKLMSGFAASHQRVRAQTLPFDGREPVLPGEAIPSGVFDRHRFAVRARERVHHGTCLAANQHALPVQNVRFVFGAKNKVVRNFVHFATLWAVN